MDKNSTRNNINQLRSATNKLISQTNQLASLNDSLETAIIDLKASKSTSPLSNSYHKTQSPEVPLEEIQLFLTTHGEYLTKWINDDGSSAEHLDQFFKEFATPLNNDMDDQFQF